jgi:hypothetical protein
MSAAMDGVNRSSEGFRRLKKQFLVVKFSKDDTKNVETRIASSRISNVSSESTKVIRQKVSPDDYRQHVEMLKKDFRLDDECVSSLLALCDHAADDEESESSGVLQEVYPSPSEFGYVAAACVAGEGIDVAHIVCRSSYDIIPSCFDWFTSARKK